MDRRILLTALFIALLFLLTLAGITVFAVRFSGAITGPILALNDGVREVSGGNLDREVVVKTGDELEQLSTSFNMMTARLRNYIDEIARATAEKQAIDTELDIATRIQMSMLPNEFPPFLGRKNQFDLFAKMYPAKEVGGDFYDFFFVDDDRFAVIVADVSGKGIPAALFMATTKTVIKDHLSSGEDSRQALNNINRQLCGGNSMGMFVTLWLGVLEISSGRLEYINAGHTPPLVKRGNNGFTFLISPPDFVLAGMNDTLYTRRETVLSKGDTLFLYTDGVTDATDSGGAFYGKDRLKNFLDKNAALPLGELLPGLRSDIAAFTGNADQWDDITMLALKLGSREWGVGSREEIGNREKIGTREQGLGSRDCNSNNDTTSELYSDTSDNNPTPHSPLPTPHSLSLKADIGELEKLNAFIGRELDASNCPRRVRNHIELAAEEIFVNISRYAYNGTEKKDVIVGCRTEPDPGGMTMILNFTDYGVPFDPTGITVPDINVPLEEREDGGLGLLIVKKTTDTIHYSRENGANRLVLSKSWQKEGQ